MKRFSVAVLSVVALACFNDRPLEPTRGVPERPRAIISDAAHGGPNAHFFFLPPAVPQPTFNGVFDRTLKPVVEVCELVNGECALPLVAQFLTKGPDDDVSGDEDQGERPEWVKVSPQRGYYRARWHTNEYNLDPAKIYRITVQVSGVRLGFADVDVVASKKELKNVNTGELIPLVGDKTLPIKFRIEQGAINQLAPGGSVAIGAAGGNVAAADGNAALAVPAGALAATKNISISTPATPPPNTGAWAAAIELGPTGTTFAQPVTLSMHYTPENLPAGVPPSALRVFSFDGTGWALVPGSSVNPANNTVSAPISHFSQYWLGIAPNSATGPGPTSLSIGQTTSMSGWAFSYDAVPQQICYYSSDTPPVWTCFTYVNSFQYPVGGVAVQWGGTNPSAATVPPGPTYTNVNGVTTSPTITGVAPGFTDVTATAMGVQSAAQRVTVTPWFSLGTMPTPRFGVSSVVLGNTIYTIGGNAFPSNPYPGQLPGGTVESYDVSTATWTTRASLPAGLEYSAAAAINGHIFVFGGWSNNLVPDSRIFEYDPATNVWTQRPNAPFRTYGGVARVLGGQIYITSGACCGAAPGLHRFDPVTGSWTRLASPAHNHDFPAVGVIGGKLYVAGGEGAQGTLDVYDPSTDSWTTRHAMPVQRQHSAGLVIDGRLVVFGGADANPGVNHQEVYSYDPSTDAWTVIGALPTARQLNSAALVGSRAYMLGGNTETDGAPVGALEAITVTPAPQQGVQSVGVYPAGVSIFERRVQQYSYRTFDGNGAELGARPATWSSSDAHVATVNATGLAATLHAGIASIRATSEGVTGSTTITVLSPFTAVAPMLTPRWGFQAVTLGNTIYTLGGNQTPQAGGQFATAVVESYDITTDQWTTRSSLPVALEHSVTAAFGGRIYVLGGWDCNLCGDIRSWSYDPAVDSWSQLPNSPWVMHGGYAAAIGSKIYATGSGCCGGITGGFVSFDPATQQWTTLPSMPRGHNFPGGGGVIGGKLYVVGGEGSNGALDVYDPATNSWTQKQSMPVKRQHGAGVVINGMLYILGGMDDAATQAKDAYAYDPATDSWSIVGTLPVLRDLNAAAFAGGFGWIFGGAASTNPFPPIGTVLRYTP